MGLDTVELVMEVEEEFGISIPDSTASEIYTVGDLAQLCFDRINAITPGKCYSLSCFLSIRKVVREIRSNKALRMRPRTRILDCLTPVERQEFWKKLPFLFQTSPPPLRRPLLLRWLITIVLAGFALALPLWSPSLQNNWSLIIAATGALWFLLLWATRCFCILPPSGLTTFGDITQKMVGLHVATHPPKQTDYDSVFSIVQAIISHQLGIELAQVTPTARFIEDLGVD